MQVKEEQASVSESEAAESVEISSDSGSKVAQGNDITQATQAVPDYAALLPVPFSASIRTKSGAQSSRTAAAPTASRKPAKAAASTPSAAAVKLEIDLS